MDGNVDTMHFFYDAQGRPAKLLHNGKMYTYIHNLQGDIVGILDAAGTMVVQYKYDAWGKPLSTTGSMADTLGKLNPFRYRGYVYDKESGMYCMPARYYCPIIHRWLNMDNTTILETNGALLGCNLYAYCANAVVNYTDPSGNAFFSALATCLVAGLVNGVIAGVSSIVYQSLTEDNVDWECVKDSAVSGFVFGTTGACMSLLAPANTIFMVAVKEAANLGLATGMVMIADGESVWDASAVCGGSMLSTLISASAGSADGFAGIIATFATGLSIGVFAEFIVILVRLCGKQLAARVREKINQNQELSKVIDDYYEFAMNYHFRTGGERKGTLAMVK